ncbi:sugar phosphate isomerase/epimerase [Paenibacillus lupini]|uniref:sugar phosphate isomerase/epimerase n=1 Tax=Paenibacillus lupini TaxID=1450204 RepID=UPI00141E9B42|nr:sugar phosphate isomerase/epimerase [Paenibacillus lupini]NIK24958.1 hypothetical protein [Paenibacillus lupini]
MNRFLIGQYGHFDYNKFYRDYKTDFYGIEACLFQEEQDITNLVQESHKTDYRIGIHFPLRAGLSNLRDALFLAQDDTIRSDAYSIVEQELVYITSRMKPDYILFHYPKPVLLDNRVDWTSWRFDDRMEFEYESEYPFEEFKQRSDVLFEWLSWKSAEYGFTPVLEFDALNRYIYEQDYLQKKLEQHSDIKLCLDTARLYLQEQIDPHFNALTVLEQYAKYAAAIHLSNMQMVDGSITQSRMPVLPNQHPSDGWAPIEEYLRIIFQENPEVRIMFEHRSEKVTDEQLEQCYRWVERMMEEAHSNH